MPLDAANVRIVWAPQPGPQYALVTCPFIEVLFGGARGGGKTDGVLGKWAIKAARYGAAFNGVFFRKEMPQADDLVERAKEIYCPMGGEWREQPRQFRMPGGGRIRFRPLENTTDAAKYQGQNLTDCAVEEAGNYEDPKPIDMLFGALRSKGGVPVQLILTANPGGVGQQWIKHRYIDPAPRGMKPLVRKLPNGAEHRYIYIPSRVQDNRILLANDPTYINRLHLVGSPELVRAWLDGDWDVIAGAFFPEWEASKHVIAPRSLPAYWAKFRSFDWGSARPFCVQWWTVSDGELAEFPRGALICYREWYGAQKDAAGRTIPNTGLRMTAEEVADGIIERERGDVTGNRVMSGVADPSIFSEDGGPSIADRMSSRKCFWRPADNARVGQSGAMGGWDQVRARLKGDGERPAVYWFSTCLDTIRTLPAQQHDDNRPEDIQTEGEDHAADACFIAGTMIETARGALPIERVTLTDQAMTRNGYQVVEAAFSVGERPVYIVRLSTGATLTATEDHPVWVEGIGFIPFHSLRYGDMMRPCQSSLLVKRSRSSWAFGISSAASTFSAKVNAFIALCGSTTTAAFRGARTSIIGTWIQATINPTIWSASLLKNTCLSTVNSGLVKAPQFWRNTLDHRRRHGIHPPMVANGTENIGIGIVGMRWLFESHENVISAIKHMMRSGEALTGFAPMPASPNGDVTQAAMMSSEDVKAVQTHSSQTASRPDSIARVSVFGACPPVNTNGVFQRVGVTIAAMISKLKSNAPSGAVTVVGEPTTAGNQKVYNLSVSRDEEYFANGVLVHNCRYGMMSRPYVAPLPPAAREPEPDGYRRKWVNRKGGRGSAMAA